MLFFQIPSHLILNSFQGTNFQKNSFRSKMVCIVCIHIKGMHNTLLLYARSLVHALYYRCIHNINNILHVVRALQMYGIDAMHNVDSLQYGEDLRKSSYTKCSAKGQSSPRSSKTGTLE